MNNFLHYLMIGIGVLVAVSAFHQYIFLSLAVSPFAWAYPMASVIIIPLTLTAAALALKKKYNLMATTALCALFIAVYPFVGPNVSSYIASCVPAATLFLIFIYFYWSNLLVPIRVLLASFIALLLATTFLAPASWFIWALFDPALDHRLFKSVLPDALTSAIVVTACIGPILSIVLSGSGLTKQSTGRPLRWLKCALIAHFNQLRSRR